jgi:hypothetical protein
MMQLGKQVRSFLSSSCERKGNVLAAFLLFHTIMDLLLFMSVFSLSMCIWSSTSSALSSAHIFFLLL